MENENRSKLAALEALLFIHGEPLQMKKISEVLSISLEELPVLLADFKTVLEDDNRGLMLVANDRSVQLATKPSLSPVIQEFMKHELTEDLTPASLEALSLVAYLGPLSRAKLDNLRGVNSAVILRNLSMRSLVERYPDPANPSLMLYRATIDLWKHLGVQSQDRLPEYEKFKTLAEAPTEPETPSEPVVP